MRHTIESQIWKSNYVMNTSVLEKEHDIAYSRKYSSGRKYHRMNILPIHKPFHELVLSQMKIILFLSIVETA